MRHFSRLQVGGGWGSPVPQAVSFALTSHTTYEQARRAGRLGGLQRLRGLDSASAERQNDSGACLILSHGSSWPAAWNQKSAWSGPLSDTVELHNVFGDHTRALCYEKSGTGASFTSTWTLLPNQPTRLRLFFFDLATPQVANQPAPLDVFHARFGAGNARWQLTRRGGSWEVARLRSTWSEAGQLQLETLLAKEDLTPGEQATIDGLRGPRVVEDGGTIAHENALYDLVESVSLDEGKASGAGKYFDLWILPEPRGRLNLRSGAGDWQSIEVPEAIASGAHSTIVGAGAVTLQTRAAAFTWQVGRPTFAPQNTLTLGPNFFSSEFLDGLSVRLRADAATLNTVAQTGSTLLGTLASGNWRDATAPNQPEGETTRSIYFDLALSTTDSRFTPFLYAAQVDLHGGLRDLDLTTIWDSNDHLDDAGNPPVLEATYSQDGEMKRQEWEIITRDPGGAVFENVPGAHLSALENHVASFNTGPTLGLLIPTLTKGLIRSATIDDLASLDPELPRILNLAHNTTTVSMRLVDVWALLDEIVMKSRPVGDGKYLGAYLRRLLLDAGFGTAEIAGISSTAGRILPRAALGEDDCIVPSDGQRLGEYLRQLVERWGMGWELFQSRAGVWTFAAPPSSVAQIQVWTTALAYQMQDAAFSSSFARNASESFPGRFAILQKLSVERDFSEFFNVFEVEGAVNPRTGLRWHKGWEIHESTARDDTGSKLWIGRPKPYDAVRDDGIRSEADLLWVLRSLLLKHARGGRLTTFTSYFHQWAQVGQLITLDNVLHRITSIVSASLARDRMDLAALEL